MLQKGQDDAGHADRFTQLILDAAERGASVTRRLLSFARQGDLRSEPVGAADLFTGLRELLIRTLGPAITIGIDVASGLPDMLADRSQTETVLINIASNARDAMPHGGTIVLSAHEETAPPELLPVRLSPGRYIRLAVGDNGVGIAAGIIDRVMEPFFTTKGSGRGTGLGLSMAKGFAEQSGGGIAIDSIVGKGTVVSMWMPVAPPMQATEPAGDPADATLAPAARAYPRILLVEDDDLVRAALGAELGAAGCFVSAKRNGEEAVLAIREGEAFDALVTDLSMPGMDGLDVIRAVHAQHPGVPAILLTGYAGDEAALAMSGSMSGTFSLLRKPIRMARLLERLHSMLGRTVGSADFGGGDRP
jgi:CheY-like chemotaxis protein